MKLSRSLLFGAVALSVSSLMGCAPRIAITTYVPAKINLGRANQLTLVQSEGRRSAREFVLAEIGTQARATGRFQVKDRTEEGITVKIAGRTVKISGGTGAPQTDLEVGLRVDVLDWSAIPATESTKDSRGVVTNRTVLTAKVLLGVTAFNATGKALLAETEYPGRLSMDASQTTEEAVIQGAARLAVTQLLRDITPLPQTRQVELDDSEEAYKPVLATVKAGSMVQAMEDTKAYVAKFPNSAAGYYNLGVFLDAQGAYEEATAAYDRAIQLGTKPLYVNARAACTKRMQDAKALME